MTIVLIPLPNRDVDPTETGVPRLELASRAHRFAVDYADMLESK
jgi:hypothetical protein